MSLMSVHGEESELMNRLLDIVHSDAKLYLVFEFLDMDLKKYMDSVGDKDGLGPPIVKVSHICSKNHDHQLMSRNSPINSSKACTTATPTASCTVTSNLRICSSTRPVT